jgi:hypothetical protein
MSNEVDDLMSGFRDWAEHGRQTKLRKPLSLAPAHSSAEPIASDLESMPTAAVQMDLFS